MMTTMQAEPRAEFDLALVIARYNEVTERLKRSHEALGVEVGRLREALKQKDRELQRRERLAALGEMAAGVAHEIRNPLGGIRLYASLLERDLVDRPKQLDLVRRLETGVRNLESVVGDILAFAGDAAPEHSAVRLEEVVERVMTQVGPQAAARGVTLEAEATLSGVVLWCDAGQIERALINLLLNAVETVAGEGTGAALRGSDGETTAAVGRVRLARGADRKCHGNDTTCCVMRVLDEGPGIDPGLLQRVFNPFFTTRHTGTGLGLAIVHRIAEAHGGWVTAGNRPEGGAVFELAVPLADAAEMTGAGSNERVR